jgi:hypothetical protein
MEPLIERTRIQIALYIAFCKGWAVGLTKRGSKNFRMLKPIEQIRTVSGARRPPKCGRRSAAFSLSQIPKRPKKQAYYNTVFLIVF